MKLLIIFAAAAALTLSVAAVASGESNSVHLRIPLGLIEPDIPIGRPFTSELISLGEELFHDPRLSGSGSTSCATCHIPGRAFSEARSTSKSDSGMEQDRNAPSLLNVGYLPTVMWDGKFRTLEEQALDPFRLDGDMGIDLDEVLHILSSDKRYVQKFEKSVGSGPTTESLASVFAAYQRSLLSGNSRFDRFLFAGDESVLDAEERGGLEVFSTRAGCLNCHDVFHPRFNPLGGGVALFTDFRFHNLGVGYSNGRMADIGRYYVTRKWEDWGAFRTPTLRNVAVTAPYMHDGSLATLEDVVEFYDGGGMPNPNLSPSISPLFLSEEDKRLLVVFLKTLTDPTWV